MPCIIIANDTNQYNIYRYTDTFTQNWQQNAEMLYTHISSSIRFRFVADDIRKYRIFIVLRLVCHPILCSLGIPKMSDINTAP